MPTFDKTDTITVKMNFCIDPVNSQHVHLGGEFQVREGQTMEEAYDERIDRIKRYFMQKFAPNAYFTGELPVIQEKDR